MNLGNRNRFLEIDRMLVPAIWVLLITTATTVGASGPARCVFAGIMQSGSWDLWTVSSDGIPTRLMETPDMDERTPVISPDRKYIAYTTSRGDLRLYQQYDRVSKTVVLPTKGRPAWPAWSVDGGGVYYVDVLMGKGPDEGAIWRYDVGSEKAEKIVAEPEVAGWPSVSYDGTFLFTTWTQSQYSRLYGIEEDSRPPKIVWDKSLTLSGAVQLPNGRICAVAGDADGQKIIILYKDGKLAKEYPMPGASGRPVLYEDRLLITRIQGGRAGIYVMELATGKTEPWLTKAPKDLVQMRDPDYR